MKMHCIKRYVHDIFSMTTENFQRFQKNSNSILQKQWQSAECPKTMRILLGCFSNENKNILCVTGLCKNSLLLFKSVQKVELYKD